MDEKQQADVLRRLGRADLALDEAFESGRYDPDDTLVCEKIAAWQAVLQLARELSSEWLAEQTGAEMSDDIVRQLREWDAANVEPIALFNAAADEIERLRQRQKSDEDQLVEIAAFLGGDARDVETGDKSIAGFVKQEVGKLRDEIERLREALKRIAYSDTILVGSDGSSARGYERGRNDQAEIAREALE